MIRRKLTLAVLCFFGGLFFIGIVAQKWSGVLFAFGAIFSLFHFCRLPRKYLLFFLLGLLTMEVQSIPDAFSSQAGRLDRSEPNLVEGRVLSAEWISKDPYRLLLTVKIKASGGNNGGGKTGEKGENAFGKRRSARLLLSYEGPPLAYTSLSGKEISFFASPLPPKGPRNPRAFDARLYYKSRGISYLASCRRIQQKEERRTIPFIIRHAIERKREEFLQALPEEGGTRELTAAILFGLDERIEKDRAEAFRLSGTGHVLAVSGLHVGILYGIYRALYRRIRHPLVTGAFVFFLLFYGTATLWTPSVTRAVLLIFLKLIADTLHRRFDLITALALVALLMAIHNPYIIFSPSFLLSFGAVLSIAMLAPHFRHFCSRRLSAALAIQTGLGPLMIYVFGYEAPLAILANLPVLFLLSLFVPLGLGSFSFFSLTGHPGPGIGSLLEGLSLLLEALTRGFAAISAFLSRRFPFPAGGLGFLCAFYGGIAGFCSEFFYLRVIRGGDKRILTGLLLFLFFSFCLGQSISATPFDRAFVVFLDVGQGDAAFCDFGKNQRFFVDGGGARNFNVGERILKPYLRRNHKGKLNISFATHHDTDHIKGLRELQAEGLLDKVTDGAARGDRYGPGPKEGKKAGTDGWYMEVLWPLSADRKRENENEESSVFKIHAGSVTLLITGDLGKEGEKGMLEAYKGTDRLKADILKVGHHGSKGSTSQAFLDAVSPTLAIISVGKNMYGHPSPVVLAKLKRNDIMIYRTDQSGAIGIIWEKDGFSLCEMTSTHIRHFIRP